jgi:hypothetical protein
VSYLLTTTVCPPSFPDVFYISTYVETVFTYSHTVSDLILGLETCNQLFVYLVIVYLSFCLACIDYLSMCWDTDSAQQHEDGVQHHVPGVAGLEGQVSHLHRAQNGAPPSCPCHLCIVLKWCAFFMPLPPVYCPKMVRLLHAPATYVLP